MLASMPLTPYATSVLDRLTRTYEAARDPVRAEPMVAYMRHQFAYLGITAPEQRALNRAVLDGAGRPTEADLRDVARACWLRDEREYQYFAVRLLRRYVGVCDAGFLDIVRPLITTKPWWDTVDELAAHVVGPLVATYPASSPPWTIGRATRTCGLSGPRSSTRCATARPRIQNASSDTVRPKLAIATSSSAKRSGGRCGSTRRSRRTPYARSSAHHPELSGLSRREALKNVGADV